MIATFVIGLREGLEAALIVVIVASFLRQRGRTDLLRFVWIGVVLAVLLCLAAAFALKILQEELPQREQEALETIVGAAAVVMVSSMVIWMQRHGRTLKGDLESSADRALTSGSGLALVLMAFFAVLREGLETAVFLLATFQASENSVLSSAGATLGIAAAVAVGFAMYLGAVRINLTKFFQATSFVLILVAAGLCLTCLHTAHEAGWVNFGQARAADLTWLLKPGSPQAAILTGMLGLQPRPTQVEALAWIVYLAAGTIVLVQPRTVWRRLRPAV